ncbi:MAG: PsbP-related protein [Candidatus Daviesbacteria bacterium]|nr:PsbP-related protein [Candidatus Daviesbacteria bacterium]
MPNSQKVNILSEYNESKGFAPILIVILIAVAIGGYLIYSNYLKNQTKINVPQQTSNTESTNSGKIANWETLTRNDNEFSFQYPQNWKLVPTDTSKNGYNFEFVDPDKIYTLDFYSQSNINKDTGKPYKTLLEFEDLVSDQLKIVVDGQEAIQVMPRAGSENANLIDVFSRDSTQIYTLKLTTNSKQDDAAIKKGQELFKQILSTFRIKQLQPAFVISKESLVGIWQNDFMLAAGWGDRYQFYPSGKYAHIASEMNNCTNTDLGEVGTWELNSNKLLLTAKQKIILKVAGTVDDPACGQKVVGGESAQEVANPKVVEIDLSARKPQANEPSYYPSLFFGKKVYWKFNDKLKDNPPFKVLPFLSGCGPDLDPCL